MSSDGNTTKIHTYLVTLARKKLTKQCHVTPITAHKFQYTSEITNLMLIQLAEKVLQDHGPNCNITIGWCNKTRTLDNVRQKCVGILLSIIYVQNVTLQSIFKILTQSFIISSKSVVIKDRFSFECVTTLSCEISGIILISSNQWLAFCAILYIKRTNDLYQTDYST